MQIYVLRLLMTVSERNRRKTKDLRCCLAISVCSHFRLGVFVGGFPLNSRSRFIASPLLAKLCLVLNFLDWCKFKLLSSDFRERNSAKNGRKTRENPGEEEFE
ncbi:hypothetical protein Nepgr_030570 [Nepenthes gracilis]|uniref:Uncharacterized protein n=1 Tax=Nepenthes gracilis TaxID=150966 RepID=A0AAD3TH87_NEPGR|nr:hypothetical protein Nepgr_030570 [Nepenthes gracilis]